MRANLRMAAATSRPVLWVLIPGFGATLFSIVQRLPLWRGDWWWGYNNLAQVLPLLMVLTALVTGWQSGSVTSGYRPQMERGPEKVSRVLSTLLGAPLVAAGLLYVAGAVFVAAVTVSGSGVIPPVAGIVVISHLSLILLAGAIGLAVGTVLPTPYSAPAAGCAVGALFFVTLPGTHNLFTLTGPVQSVVGLTPSLERQLIVLAASLAASLVLLWLAAQRQRSRGVSAGAVGAALLSLMLGSVVAPSSIFVVADQEPSRCLEGSIKICVYPGYDAVLQSGSEQIQGVLKKAESLGVASRALPNEYRQFGSKRPPVGVGTVSLSDEARRTGRLTASDLALTISDPLWCPTMFAENPPLDLLETRDLVFDWLLWVQGDLSTEELRSRHSAFGKEPEARWGGSVIDALKLSRQCAA